MKKIITTTNAPAAVGPYSQAIVAEKVIFLSGQLPIDKDSGIIPRDITRQTKICLENIENILSAAGKSINDIVKCTVFLTDMINFKAMNDQYKKHFDEKRGYPARSCIEVSKLPNEHALIEIEAIAV